MRARDLMLAATGGGLLLGSALGMTTSTTMKPAPAPPWRQAARDAAGSSHAPVEAEQPDINSAWSPEDRTPTWKRHQPEYQQAGYDAPPPEPMAEPEPEPATPDAATTPPDAAAEPPVDSAAPAAAGA